jgi:perosamine synthetase
VPPPETPWCAPDVSGNEAPYTAAVIRHGQIGPAGEYLSRFEHEVAQITGARHAVATSSGTAALQMALLLAGVQPGAEVIVPAWTFVATANAVRHAGAHPVTLDVDPHYWQLDPGQVDRFLTERCHHQDGHLVNIATGRPVTAIIPVHLLGHPAPLDELRALSSRSRLELIADAAQALGASYRGRPVAAGGLSAISFNANKIITTGGGGAICTDDRALATRARYLIGQARDHPDEYRHGEVGYNYRMSNVAAAIGCAQLERIGAFLAAKQLIATTYEAALAGIGGITFPCQAEWAVSNRWLASITVDERSFGMTAATLRAHLADNGIQTGPPWTPLHRTGAHHGTSPWPCPVADRLAATAVHLPCSTTLTASRQYRVINVIRQAAAAA